jgi:voltage-gated potassium channel
MKALLSMAPGCRHGGWRRIESIALLATIPAFYLAMLPGQRSPSVMLYLVALGANAGTSWSEAAAAAQRQSTPSERGRSHLGLLLGLALLLCALLPQGDSPDLLILRLGTAALVILRWSESTLPLRWRSGLPQLLGLGIGVLGLCGLGFWWLEPKAHTFGDGLWLAFTTAATVGYGDIVPSTPAAKIFAVFVVLMGFAVLSLVTASIAALWVQTEERRIEHEVLHDLHRELRVIRDELATLRREARSTPDALHAVQQKHAHGDSR